MIWSIQNWQDNWDSKTEEFLLEHVGESYYILAQKSKSAQGNGLLSGMTIFELNKICGVLVLFENGILHVVLDGKRLNEAKEEQILDHVAAIPHQIRGIQGSQEAVDRLASRMTYWGIVPAYSGRTREVTMQHDHLADF